MSDTKEATTLPLAEVVKLVKRKVQAKDDKGKLKLDDNGKPVMKEVALKADEVLSFKVYTESVVVVTTDGQKLVGKIKQ